MPISPNYSKRTAVILLAVLASSPLTSSCQKKIKTLSLDNCGPVNIVEKRRIVINDMFNLNRPVRDITAYDKHGGNPHPDNKYPVPHAPYNTVFDLDLTDQLKHEGEAVPVRIVIKDHNISFQDFPNQITAGNFDSQPMFCGLTHTAHEHGNGSPEYVEFYVKYGSGTLPYHIGKYNINLIATDENANSNAVTPFTIDPHIGNNG